MSERILLVIESIGLSALLLLSVFIAPQTLITTGVVVFCFLYATHRLAPRFFPEQATWPSLFLMLVVILGLQSVLQTGLYYLNFSLNLWTDVGTEIATLFILYSLTALSRPSVDQIDTPPSFADEQSRFQTLIRVLFPSAFLVPALIGIVYLLKSASIFATNEAIRSPWTLLPSGTILGFLCVFGAAWLMAWRGRSLTLSWLLVTFFFASVALMTPLLYPLGFGFDGFLHRASEQVLFQTGVLHPKPFYYIGQYTLVTWLARTFGLSLRSIDVFLLTSLIASLGASLSFYPSSTTKPRHRILSATVAMSLVGLALLLPLKPWITTTPQSLAYLIGLSGLFLASAGSAFTPLFPPLLFGIWSTAIHPLAGLPFLGAILLALVRSHLVRFPKTRAMGSVLIVIGTAVIVPLAFFLNSLYAGARIEWQFAHLLSPEHLRTFFYSFLAPPVRISLWADWSAFVDYLFPLVLFGLAAFGLRSSRAEEIETQAFLRTDAVRWLTFAGVFVMGGAWFMRQAATFTFLIDYERQDYPQRLLFIGQLFLLPAAIRGFVRLWMRLKHQPSLTLYSFVLIAMAWQGARVYHALPYHDATHVEHGWNTSAAALEAVRWIEHDSAGELYTVLADQSVSAGAVAELGFKRYAGEVFFYPLPTGGPLYQVFLRATSLEATKQDIEKAAELGQSSLVYVILNDYWWQADEVAERLTKIGGSAYTLPNGSVRIYRFSVKSAKKF